MGIELLLMFGVLGAVGLGFTIISYLKKKRKQQLAQIADDLGFVFDQDAATLTSKGFTHLGLFAQGHSSRFRNAMEGMLEDIQVVLFDYQYTTGAGRNRRTRRQTVAAFHTPSSVIPAFTLRRERFFHKIGQWFGYQDIDFKDYPLFSKKYLLRGPDEHAIRGVFTETVIGFFEQNNPRWIVEADGQWMVVYKQYKRVKPANMQDFLDNVWDLFLVFPTA